MEKIDKLIKKVDKYTKKSVKKSRYEHSVRVAQMCSQLCKKFGMDEKIGYLAGIGHDMCKEFNYKKMIELASKYDCPIMEFELKKPSLLHGRAAAVMMKKKFKIENHEILEAVAFHTTGTLNMCDLTKCLFLADKIEPGRPQSTEEYRENLLKLDLPSLFLSVLNENYEYLIKNGIEIDNNTKEIVKFYNSENNG